MLPKIKAIPKPPKIGSVASRRLPSMIAITVSKIGFALVAMAMALFLSIPSSAINALAKSISSSELLALVPINDINPMRDVAVKKKWKIRRQQLQLLRVVVVASYPF